MILYVDTERRGMTGGLWSSSKAMKGMKLLPQLSQYVVVTFSDKLVKWGKLTLQKILENWARTWRCTTSYHLHTLAFVDSTGAFRDHLPLR